MHRCWILVIVAAIVVAYQLQETEAKFSFSLPGRWGGAKRGGSFSFSLPGKWGGQAMGKRSEELGQCGEVDPDAMFYIYSIIKAEAIRMNDCVNGKETLAEEKH